DGKPTAKDLRETRIHLDEQELKLSADSEQSPLLLRTTLHRLQPSAAHDKMTCSGGHMKKTMEVESSNPSSV
ncbi:MAG: hypothetical protein WBL63_24000, partial [Candidatus Acidiferrum sp.]